MLDGPSAPEISVSYARPPHLVNKEAVNRLNRMGMRDKSPLLQIVDKSREAIANLPEGKSGIVIGCGKNAPEWRQKGWLTLDINPSSGADVITDANLMDRVIPPGSQDFILAEHINFDPQGVTGVIPEKLIQQANSLLKMGGQVIIQTAHFENNPRTTLPDRVKFADMMTRFGFEPVVEMSVLLPIPSDNGMSNQAVVYHGKKVA